MQQPLNHTPKALAKKTSRARQLFVGLRYRVGRKQPVRLLSPRIERAVARQGEEFRQLTFTFAIIALSAHVARVDGVLTHDKYAAFRESFPLRGGYCGKIRLLFALACENPTPHTHYITQVGYLFPRRQALFDTLVDRLFAIAAADGALSLEAERLLSDISQRFGVSPPRYAAMLRRHGGQAAAHELLDMPKRPPKSLLKRRYHALMRHYHPDNFAGDTLSPEVERVLTLRTAQINEAYRRLSRKAA